MTCISSILFFLIFIFPTVLMDWPVSMKRTTNIQVTSKEEYKKQYSDALKFSKNMSIVLENLLRDYDSNQRPGYGGAPTVVTTNFLIRSMGPISEVDMEYSMDCYFRQKWTDRRLRFDGPIKNLSLNIKMLDRIWKPDTYFHNGKGSYLHTITRPNKLLRIFQNGEVLYSMRLTVKATCPMQLQNFPMDRQFCPLIFGSYGYTVKHLIYRWETKSAITFEEGLVLSQYDLIDYPHRNVTVTFNRGEFSVLKANFNLRRRMGYFLIQVYVPCTLIVVLSWVSFWINREATSDRIGLGITTVLTLSTFGLDTRTDLPKVPYPTALDWFVIMSFMFVIATLLEFAGVHYFTKVGSGEFPIADSSDNEEKITMMNTNTPTRHYCPTIYGYQTDHKCPKYPRYTAKLSYFNRYSRNCCYQFWNCILGSETYRAEMLSRVQGKDAINSVSKIDQISRILFPLSFVLLNIFYWLFYTSETYSSNRTNRELHSISS
ncbi:gamma-aminobutyric acid receptor alpha-like [Centruroides sculpturatus]|uniref:gamma-aminobutyric acid receptor alpha-like n=1 Tax=Centruroides sculpturatus TaxID=218467 RepID=UPI000C6DCA8B|nr:gamma-aminobutyric acid receptor alpha-like [Centruroides sculpturatus]